MVSTVATESAQTATKYSRLSKHYIYKNCSSKMDIKKQENMLYYKYIVLTV